MRMLFAALLLVFSCGKKEEAKEPIGITEAFHVKQSLYKKLYLEKTADRFGYTSKGCDATTYSSLVAIALGEDKVSVTRSLSKDRPGLVLRRATDWPECFVAKESASETSRDVYTGFFALMAAKSPDYFDLAETIRAYGVDNNWTMGQGDPFRTGLRGNLKAILYGLVAKGRKLSPHEQLAAAWPDLLTGLEKGYERHLAATNILSRALLDGGIPGQFQKWLNDSRDEQPNNPLYEILAHKWEDGDMSNAVDMLMDETHWPADHLPNNHDNHCDVEWLIQRDDGSDWKPCPKEEFEEDTGGAWLYMAALMKI